MGSLTPNLDHCFSPSTLGRARIRRPFCVSGPLPHHLGRPEPKASRASPCIRRNASI